MSRITKGTFVLRLRCKDVKRQCTAYTEYAKCTKRVACERIYYINQCERSTDVSVDNSTKQAAAVVAAEGVISRAGPTALIKSFLYSTFKLHINEINPH